jgi:endonuclease G, mitochondrial
MLRYPTRAIALAVAAFAFTAIAAEGAVQNPIDPQSCAAIWQAIGLPQDVGDETSPVTTVCHLGYITGHNNSRKAPNWVIERLTPKLTEGKARRGNKTFDPDPALPEAARANDSDYKGNQPFDRGHNAPAADFAGNQDFLFDTFFFSNVVPQVGAGFNRSIWASLESQVRGLIGDNHPVLYVITGSIWQQAEPIKIANDTCGTEMTLPVVKPAAICPATAGGHASAKCAAGVSVPAAMFKIVYDPDMENAFAVLLQNESHAGRYHRARDYIEAHRIGISTIEQLTGLRFFSALPKRKQREMRDACVDVRVH